MTLAREIRNELASRLRPSCSGDVVFCFESSSRPDDAANALFADSLAALAEPFAAGFDFVEELSCDGCGMGCGGMKNNGNAIVD